MNKRAGITDIGFFVVSLFALGLILLVFYTAQTYLVTALSNQTAFNSSTPAMNVMNTASNSASSKLDMLFSAIFIGYLIALIITGYLIDASPIFLTLFIIMFAIIIILAGILSYAWENISTVTIFNTAVANMPITNHILSNLSVYTVIAGVLSMFALYYKNRSNNSGGGVEF